MAKCPEWLSIIWKGKLVWIDSKGNIAEKKPLTGEDIRECIEILRKSKPIGEYLVMPLVFPNALGLTKEEIDNVTKQAENSSQRYVRKSSSSKRKRREKKGK